MVVVVGTADEVGRIAPAKELDAGVADVEDEREGEAVTVEVVEVVAVAVEVDVTGTVELVVGVVEGLDVLVLEELVGDSVTVGWTVEVTVEPTMPLQIKS